MRNTLITYLLFIICSISALGQNLPSLLIDNLSTQFSESSLPYWLKAGQTINIGNNAQSVSIIEFTINGVNLEFTQIITLTTAQTVPANKVWKIEAIGLIAANSSIPSSIFSGSGTSSSAASLPTIFQSPKKFEIPGTYNWTVPPGITSICIEVWSGGGGGGGASYGGLAGGGGGGGYAYQCFTVVPGTTYSVNVGSGGTAGTSVSTDGTSGGNSSFGNLVVVTGGAGGGKNSGGANDGIGGLGGNSSSTFAIPGNNGSNGTWSATAPSNGNGGNGANGGNGGKTIVVGSGQPGDAPGGAGSGGRNAGANGGAGARGQVYIYW
jgi:hypothetical protein